MRRRPLRLLVTAGPTREYLDPLRFISNDSSGRMGLALAAAARRRGHRVTLVHGPVALRPPPGLTSLAVTSAADMLRACRQNWPQHDALLMAAAVADYTPARRAPHKLDRSAPPPVLRLRPTPDILAGLARSRRPDQVVVGFALQDRAARRNARRKLLEKGLDAIVLSRPGAIGAVRAAAEILVRGRPWQSLPPVSKQRLAARLIRLVEQLHRRRAATPASARAGFSPAAR